MSNEENIELKMQNIMKQLSELAKKPTLDTDISDILKFYHSSFAYRTNFSEAGILLETSSTITGKQIDLLYKQILDFHINLTNAFREDKAENQPGTSEVEALPVPVEKPKRGRKKKIQNEEQQTAQDGQQQITPVDQQQITPDGQQQNTPNGQQQNTPNGQQQIAPDDQQSKIAATVETEKEHEINKKLEIPGVPQDILDKLKLSDCLLGGPLDEFIEKLSPNHPLRTLFQHLGKEMCQNKDVYTYNNLSLSTMSWRALYQIEAVLKRKENIQLENDESAMDTSYSEEIAKIIASENESENYDSGIDSTPCFSHSECTDSLFAGPKEFENQSENPAFPSLSSTLAAVRENNNLNSETAIVSDENETKNMQLNDELNPFSSDPIEPTPESAIVSDMNETNNPMQLSEELNPVSSDPIEPMTESSSNLMNFAFSKIKKTDLAINLFRFPIKHLRKINCFKLPEEYKEYLLARIRMCKNSRSSCNNTDPVPSKRRKIEDFSHLMKNSNTYDLNEFEAFCQSYYEGAGMVIPQPKFICPSRKSIDARSEISYGNPVTPESGHCSMMYHNDSDNEHEEDDDHRRMTVSRADSGIEMSGAITPSSVYQSQDIQILHEEEEGGTLKTLKSLFPTTFSDPERAEMLKELYQQPEDNEEYVKWKKFIEQQEYSDKDFDVHEYESNIMESFPSKTEGETLSFQQLAQGKSSRETARMFLSAMHLATSGNIEIEDQFPNEVRPDSMKLKYLNDEKAHEHIDDFHLPSESTFMESLLENRKNTKICQSTPLVKSSNSQTLQPSHKKKHYKRRKIDFAY